ncbi:MAG: 4Fe-4S single cluster domain-containing protein [Ignavibacteria bacterium]|nr:4Fe-4S single cluster domain-containing protein [Ignavibacteria bacterium]
MYIKLNRIQYPVYNLGPGKRIGIWVQGCSLMCSGCLNPSTWNKKNGKFVEIKKLVNILIPLQQEYDGITISGGEPFEQYHSLVILCSLIKQYTKFDIYCFTGYYLKELESTHKDKTFKYLIDYLVDGRYEEGNQSSNNIVGSKNQNLYKFVNGRAYHKNKSAIDKKWSISYKDKVFYMAGIPSKNDLEKVTTVLNKSNIKSKYL